MLRRVSLKVTGDILPEVLQEKVVVLPNLEVLFMLVNDGGPGYGFAAHVSCPSGRVVSFLHRKVPSHAPLEEIFPNPVSWDAISRQYSGRPPEAVTLEIKIAQNPIITSSLNFHSPDETNLELAFQVTRMDGDEFDDELMLFEVREMHCKVFLQASRTIRDHRSPTGGQHQAPSLFPQFHHSWLHSGEASRGRI